MVEAVPAKIDARLQKLFWQGSNLPSMGCLITVFSFYGYRKEVQALLRRINVSGESFFDKHLDNQVIFRDDRLWFETKPHRYVNVGQGVVING